MEVGSHQNGIPKHVFLPFFFHSQLLPKGLFHAPRSNGSSSTKVMLLVHMVHETLRYLLYRQCHHCPLALAMGVPFLPMTVSQLKRMPHNASRSVNGSKLQWPRRRRVVCVVFFSVFEKSIRIDRVKGRCLCFWALSISWPHKRPSHFVTKDICFW